MPDWKTDTPSSRVFHFCPISPDWPKCHLAFYGHWPCCSVLFRTSFGIRFLTELCFPLKSYSQFCKLGISPSLLILSSWVSWYLVSYVRTRIQKLRKVSVYTGHFPLYGSVGRPEVSARNQSACFSSCVYFFKTNYLTSAGFRNSFSLASSCDSLEFFLLLHFFIKYKSETESVWILCIIRRP